MKLDWNKEDWAGLGGCDDAENDSNYVGHHLIY